MRARVFEHPSDSCGSHAETGFVDNHCFLPRQSHVSKQFSEIVSEFLKTLRVGSRDEVVEEVGMDGSWNVRFEIGFF